MKRNKFYYSLRGTRNHSMKNCNILDTLGLQYTGRVHYNLENEEIQRLSCCDQYDPLASEVDPSIPMLSCKFSPPEARSDVVAAVDEHGNLTLHNIRRISKPLCRVRSHENAVFDLIWSRDNNQLLTFSGDHTTKLWDCSGPEPTMISKFVGHRKSVKTGKFRPNDSGTFVTGSRDGTVMLWDPRCHSKSGFHKPDQVIPNAAVKGSKQPPTASVTSLAFYDSNTLAVAGSADSVIRLWDLRKTYSHNKAKCLPKRTLQAPKSGFVDMVISPEGRLYASCINDRIHCFNVNGDNTKPVASFVGHQTTSFYAKICISPDGNYLLSGSLDKNVYVWSTRQAEQRRDPINPLVSLGSDNDHQAEVTGVDISQKGLVTIISCSDDGTLRKWEPSYDRNEVELRRLSNAQSTVSSRVGMSPVADSSASSRSDEQVSSDSGAPNEVDITQAAFSDSISHNAKSNEQAVTSDAVSLNGDPTKSGEQATLFSDTVSLNVDATKSSEQATVSACVSPTTEAFSSSMPGSSKRKRDSVSPLRTPSKRRLAFSPRKENANDSKYQSPTANLPNYVIDGTGPSHRCTRQKENLDWLTRMQRAKRSEEKSSEKVKSDRGKKRQLNSGKSDKKSRKTLLEYYKKSSRGPDDVTQKSGESFLSSSSLT